MLPATVQIPRKLVPMEKRRAPRNVTIVIPFRDQLKYLRRTLASITAAHEPGFKPHLVLIDNASIGTLNPSVLEATGCTWTLIRNDKNRAVSEPWNLGIRLGFEMHNADAVCLLNSDVLVGKGWMSRCVQALDRGAYCSFPFCYTEGDGVPADFARRARLAANGKLAAAIGDLPRKQQHGEGEPYFIDDTFNSASDLVEMHETDGFSGFCFWVSKECVSRIGYIDQNMSLVYSDTDYRNRLLAARHPPVCVHTCFTHHFGSKTLYAALHTPAQRRIILQDRRYFHRKWTSDYDQKFRIHCIAHHCIGA